MNKKRAYISLFLLATILLGVQVVRSRPDFSSPDQILAQEANKKEISKDAPRFAAPLGNGFSDINSPPEYLSLGSEYWVRLTIHGRNTSVTTTTVGSDIMLVLDVTGSMTIHHPIGPSNPNVNTSRIQAAKQALRQFVDNANPADQIGFATYATCDAETQRYYNIENNIPLSWVYEGNTSSGQRHGYAYLHIPLAPVSAAQKNKINNLLQDTGTNGVLRYENNQIIFCRDAMTRATQTDSGGGLVAGLSQLSNIIQSQRRQAPNDQTLFRTSLGGTFQSPNYRSDKKKYVVLASDGGENAFPRFYEPQPLIQQLNIPGVDNAVEYAQSQGIIVYTLSIAQDSSSFSSTLSQVARDTGGKYFPGSTRDELIASYTSIYDEVEEVSTSSEITILENINTDAFRIPDLKANIPDRFYISRVENGSETNVTNQLCSGGNCITKINEGSYSFNLPAIDPSIKYHIYFKVQPTRTALDPVAVDTSDSKVIYSPTLSAPIENKFVVIDSPEPFFQASQGDLYSEGDITNNLRDGEYMMYKEPSILFRNDGLNIGAGKVNPPERDVRYRVNENENYEYFVKLLESQIADKTITGPATRADISPTGPSLDKYIVRLKNSSGRINFQGNGNFNDNINRVVFVEGDLFISQANYRINPNGRNGLTFIVSGNIGIAPSIEKLEGIFIANGYIDTVCGQITGFGAGECTPSTAPDTLIVEGSVISINGGVRLQRRGNPIGTISEREPGEEFIYRPDLVLSAVNALGKVQRTWKEALD